MALTVHDTRTPRNDRVDTPRSALAIELEGAVERVLDRRDAMRAANDERPPKRLYSIRDAALALDTSHTTIYALIRRGMAGVVTIGATRKIEIDVALAWIREHGADEVER